MRIGARVGLVRIAFLLILPFLVALQLFVGLRLPQTHLGGLAAEDGIAFSVISIEPQWKSTSGSPGPKEEEDDEARVESHASRGYEDENEMLTRQGSTRGVELQLWAAGQPSFTAELQRILAYLSRPQMKCSRVLSPGESQPSQPPPAAVLPWLLCADQWLLPATRPPCVAYSFSMDAGDAHFLRTVLGLGCEVHRFDPSNLNTSGGPLRSSLDSNHGDGVVNHHKMWLEWRKHKTKKRRVLGSSQSLTDIMEALGHYTVHFLFADLLSAEWRVFQNWVELGSLRAVHHLVVTVHLNWAGFEVGGSDEEVLRYWFSTLVGLQASGLRLVNISPGEGHSVLKQTVMDAHSSYILSWVSVRS